MTIKLYRIQDKEGRGPFRPGFSHKWVDSTGHSLPPWYVEMPGVLASTRFTDDRHHFGTACRSPDGLRRWFTKDEYTRLILLGYEAVELNADKLYGESDNQCVFGRRRALRKGVRPFRLYD